MMVALHCLPWLRIDWHKIKVYIYYGIGVIAAKLNFSMKIRQLWNKDRCEEEMY